MTCEYLDRCKDMRIDRPHCNNGGDEVCGMWLYLRREEMHNAAHIKIMWWLILGMFVTVCVMVLLAMRNVA